ncbi:putative transcriptional regulatory [Hyphodiscus hymeniophilus]|uniref:Transcriptional regulatory n=1 Tax=Hyphodiscus hymeniophilus TaxID=353542 RepID=A0A9P6VJK4_9HELO|nr:putative transcriptional regulatory [Hyphodiscus hymeniophilus]
MHKGNDHQLEEKHALNVIGRSKGQCNKEQPCSNCVRRNVPDACVYVSRQERRQLQRRHEHAPDMQRKSHVESVTVNDPRSPVELVEQQRQAVISNTRPLSQHLGRLFKARGAPSYHGNSYFGHQSAADMMEASTLEMSGGPDAGLSHRSRTCATQAFRSERGPYAHIWELIGSLPRQKAVVDYLTRRFFDELNPSFDAVHEETFQISYEKFWDRKCGYDDLSSVDVRWLSLLFIILAFGELLDCNQPCSPEAQRACEESSLHFYWSARKAVVIAPSFFGETPDLVRAGILITRYLMYTRRLSESWLTICFAVRMAQAQGMHVDGEQLGLPRKNVETRRRLWSQLYVLERMIALALGRPNTINDRHCGFTVAVNIWVDDMTNEQARVAVPKPFQEPTPATFSVFNRQLAVIVGTIQEECFPLFAMPRDTSYDEILAHDARLLEWKDKLPSYFSLDATNTSLDESHPYLFWHRLYLHTAYHFTRITLHRSYLLRPSFTDRFQYSRAACLSSACADLRTKLGFRNPSMGDRVRYNISAHQLFNSALILGVIVVRDPNGPHTESILNDLEAYCNKQNMDTWTNDFDLAEVRVIELCISRARQSRNQGQGMVRMRGSSMVSGIDSSPVSTSHPLTMEYAASLGDQESYENLAGYGDSVGQYGVEVWSDMWSNPGYYFPEPLDFQIWKDLVEDLAGN